VPWLGGNEVQRQPAEVALLEGTAGLAWAAAARGAEFPAETPALTATPMAVPAAVSSIVSLHVVAPLLEKVEVQGLAGDLGQEFRRIDTSVSMPRVSEQAAERAVPPAGPAAAFVESMLSSSSGVPRISSFVAFPIAVGLEHAFVPFVECEPLLASGMNDFEFHTYVGVVARFDPVARNGCSASFRSFRTRLRSVSTVFSRILDISILLLYRCLRNRQVRYIEGFGVRGDAHGTIRDSAERPFETAPLTE
jgi:hypothetical protein